MYVEKANILFILKIATDLLETQTNGLSPKYYKQILRAFKRFNKSGEHFYYKITLSDIDLEKLNMKFLFFKNDLQELETKFEVIRVGDLFKEHILFHDYKKATEFDSLILFKQFLDYDKLYNVLYVNKRQLKFIKDLEAKNNIEWYRAKDNEEEYNIIKKGAFSLRSKHIQKLYINEKEDIESLTLEDVLRVVSFKNMVFGFNGIGNGYKEPSIKEKINEMINEIERKTYYDENNTEIKVLFIHHLRSILYKLFQSNEEEETCIDDYFFQD